MVWRGFCWLLRATCILQGEYGGLDDATCMRKGGCLGNRGVVGMQTIIGWEQGSWHWCSFVAEVPFTLPPVRISSQEIHHGDRGSRIRPRI